MNKKTAYALGILALALSIGCAKRGVSPEIGADTEDFAAWLPEEMNGMLLFSSLEALKAAQEQLKESEGLEKLNEGLWSTLERRLEEEEGQEPLELFSLTTWQGMGIAVDKPWMLGGKLGEETLLLAVPVVDAQKFAASVEARWGKAWAAQTELPEGLRAWKLRSGDFVVLSPKPGYTLVWIGDELDMLVEHTRLDREKSWAKKPNKEAMQNIALRLPADRLLTGWLRLDAKGIELGIDCLGLALVTQPRTKVVIDVTWTPGARPWLPRMQQAPFNPEQWAQGLGNAAFAVWSAVPMGFYTQLLQHPVLEASESDRKIFDALVQSNEKHFEPTVLVRGQVEPKAKEPDEDEQEYNYRTRHGNPDIHMSADGILKEGIEIKEALEAWTALVSGPLGEALGVEGEKVVWTQPNPEEPIWKALLKEETLWAHASEQNKIRFGSYLHSYEEGEQNALHKLMLQEMQGYPMAAVLHLSKLAALPIFDILLGSREMKKTEYLLLGLRAEEGYAQLVAEHFVD